MKIEVQSLNKSFGGKRVLENFSATFGLGFTWVRGASGSGKTTLFNILLGLLASDSGTITVRCETDNSKVAVRGETDNDKASARDKTDNGAISMLSEIDNPNNANIIAMQDVRFSAVFQEDRLCEGLSANKNVALVCDKSARCDVAPLLASLGLRESLSKRVSEFSGGMKRRVAIARALIVNADVYIFDEPFKGLDDAAKSAAIEVIKSRTEGKIVLLATHDKSDALAFNAATVDI